MAVANRLLRVMPLGASITWGQGSSTGNGYRQKLKEFLADEGIPIEYVGSQSSGTMTNGDNEGWPGAYISDVFKIAKESIPNNLPDLVLINAGTNDAGRNIDITHAHERMLQILELVWGVSPSTTVVLSTLIRCQNSYVNRNALVVNEGFKKMALEQQENSRRLVLVDMRAEDGPQVQDLYDGLHPNDAGYEKMAALWLAGIKEAGLKGWLDPLGSPPS